MEYLYGNRRTNCYLRSLVTILVDASMHFKIVDTFSDISGRPVFPHLLDFAIQKSLNSFLIH